MPLLRRLIQTICVLLIMAFGAVCAVAAPARADFLLANHWHLSAGETVTLAGAVSTDYTSTVSNRNSGFTITDTTEVSQTQSISEDGAGFTKISSGGATVVTGSQRVVTLDKDSASFGLNAKSLIGIDGATSQTRLDEHLRPKDPSLFSALTQGGADQPSQGASTAGSSDNPAYNFAGSTVNIGVPTALDDAGYAYLDHLNASGQLTVEEMKLVQHQFYDQKVQLGTLGKLLLKYLTTTLTGGIAGFGGLAGWQQAMISTGISGSIEGAVTGNFDLGKILKDVAFAGASGAITAEFNLNENLKIEKGPSLLGAKDGKFTWANIVDGVGDSAVTAGLITAVYGGKLGDNFKSAFTSTVVNFAQADLQSLIGDQHTGANALVNGGEGSAGHVLKHFGVGCIAGAALGGSCAASGVAAGISAIYAGAVDPKRALRNSGQAIATAELFGGFGAAVASGGDLNATMVGAGVAGSAFENNYLKHDEWVQYLADLDDCGADQACRQTAEARYIAISKFNQEAMLACGSDIACLHKKKDEIISSHTDPEIRKRLEAEIAKGNVETLLGFDFTDATFLNRALNPTNGEMAANGLQNPYLAFANDYATFKNASCAAISGQACLAAFNAQYPAQIVATLPSEMAANAFEVFALTGVGGTIAGTYSCATGLSLASCADAALELLPAGLDAGAKVLIKQGNGYIEATIGVYPDGTKYLDTPEIATITKNRDTHTKALERADKQFESAGIGINTEVSLQSCTGTVCRADRILTLPEGSTQTTIDVPQGFTATQLVNGVEVPIQRIPVSSGQAKVVVEMKTGKAELSTNQDIGYNEISQGTVTGVGKNAEGAEISGQVPSDLPVVILRPN